MAGIIKKQILKHLSRFTKNLSPDKINLSTLKGEGQLSNLELDEEVLQNMLDLPTWLAVTRVYCNKAAIRIQWTKLKTSPICLFLDKVEVEMRTCEEPRAPNGPSPIASTAGQSEYGFAEKVVEGMSVIINSITIKVQARAFHASFELWQLQGCSLNPKWQKDDLRYTRITHPKRGEVLTFKEINWQSLRIEADAIERDEQDLGSTPLRLITNQGCIRIALKRRVKDCDVLASKLLFILDDLLWVLTDSQLKAIIHYAKSLSEAMEKSGQQRKSMAAETLQTAPPSPGIHSLWTEPPPPEAVGTPSTLAQYFDLHDVKESSYHTFISRLDLHICNDSSSDSDEAPPPGTQGAMQLTFRKLGCDYYPLHRPGDGCRHWERHCGAMESRAQWAAKLLQEFQRRVEDLGFPGPHPEPNMSAKDSPPKKIKDGESLPNLSPERSQTSRRTSAAVPSSGPPLKRLRSSCMVIRVDDLEIHQVSTGGRHSKRTQSLFSCNRKSLHLLDNTPAIHLQFTEYYYPDNPGLPVPSSNLYAQLNGLQMCLDAPSVLWMTLFSRGLHRTLDQVKAFYHLQDSSKTDEHIDIRLDATQLKLIIPLESSFLDHPDRPQSLSVSLPQIVLSNTRHTPHGSHSDLNSTYSSFSVHPFFHPTASQPFPRDQSVLHPLPSAFLQHSLENESQSLAHKHPSRSQDVWSVSLSQVTLGFEGARRGLRGKALPFVEPFAISLWICCPSAFKKDSHCSNIVADSKSSTCFSKQPLLDSQQGVNNVASSKVDQTEDLVNSPMASIHILAQSITPVKMWLNHYQFLALLRMKEYLARLAGDLTKDVQGLGQPEHKTSDPPLVCLSILMEAIELALLLPPATSEQVEEAHSPEETDSPSLTDPDLSPSHHAGEPVLMEDSGTGRNEDQEDDAEQEGSVEEACEAVEEGMDGPTGQDDETQAAVTSSSPLLSPGNPALLSHHSSTFSLEGELSSALNATKGVTKDALSASLDLTKGALSITKDAFSMLSRGSGMTKLFTPQNKEQSARPEESSPSIMGNQRLQSMKQSPSQNSCDSAILESSLSDDGLSIDSDISENFVILMDSGVSGSCVSPAPGTDLSSSLSQSTEDIAQDMVSVLVLCLSRMGCLTEMRGEDIVVALEAQELVPKQHGNHKVTDLLGGLALTQAGSSSPSAPLSPGPRSLSCPPAAALRMEMGPRAARHSPLSESVGFMEMCLTGCKAELLASTLNMLGPFLEDELSTDPQPMRLWLRDTAITLKDDGPRLYPTAPQPVPVLFSLDGIVLECMDDGILSLRPAQSQSGIETDEDKDRAGQSCFRAEEKNKSLESRLADVQSALEKAQIDRERLLQEVMKHNPSFTL
ncbi:bridge-like lipid transfer protein family member 3A isoform X2 [Carassius carassius]|uniref:bridge-like lipid transfer protein family member 3A isoform X2 n=1 Tax=Carassius carassius TaxID=217509 RepID=UPI0028697342|nr:bridge-like lipid transfer protein family member 3A isoform X2 [Carassius carassius]